MNNLEKCNSLFNEIVSEIIASIDEQWQSAMLEVTAFDKSINLKSKHIGLQM